MELSELLGFAVKNGASDIHVTAGLPPLIRIDGEIRRIKVDVLPDHQVLEELQLRPIISRVRGSPRRARIPQNRLVDPFLDNQACRLPNLQGVHHLLEGDTLAQGEHVDLGAARAPAGEYCPPLPSSNRWRLAPISPILRSRPSSMP